MAAGVPQGALEAGPQISTQLKAIMTTVAPGGALGIIDLAQVEPLPLGHAPGGETLGFDDTPVGVLLASFFANLRTQKHNDRREYTRRAGWEEGRSSLHALLRNNDALSLVNSCAAPPKRGEIMVESAK